jgi:radical SAM superfamily enzyme YgiQ (UPF0313 family)
MSKVVLVSLYDESCVGARSLAAYLEEQGHECHIIHFKAFRVPIVRYDDKETWKMIEESNTKTIPTIFPEGARFISFPTPITDKERHLLVDYIAETGPALVGFSLYSTHVPLARELTGMVRDRLPQVPIAWGGVHPAVVPDDCFPDADIVCTGEGEYPVTEFLENPSRRDIKGLWFYDRQRGEIIRNPLRELIEDLDSLPFTQWGIREYLIENDSVLTEPMGNVWAGGHFRISTTRNCPFRCAYCVHSVLRDRLKGLGTYVRRRSVDHVIKEIVLRKKQFNLRSVLFSDELFIMDMKWLQEFVEKYKAAGLDIPFYGTGQPQITTREMLVLLRNAGMDEACVGVQSGSERILHEVFERHATLDQIRQTAKWLNELNFKRVQYDIVSNTPYESEEDCRKTLDLLCELPKPFDLFIYKLVSFPTCKMDKMGHHQYNLDENTFFFYNMLYLLTQKDRLPTRTVKALLDDPYLRENPMLLSDLASAVLGEDTYTRELDWKIKYLESQLAQRTLRNLLKERAKKRLPSWLWNILRRGKAALSAGTAAGR